MRDFLTASIGCPRINIQAGFTMVEILIALALFVFGILSLMELQASSIRSIAAAQIQTESTAIGTAFIERLRLLPIGHPHLDSSGNPHQLKRDSYRGITIQWKIVDDPIIPGTRSLKVVVTPDNQFYGKPVTIHTILGREEDDDNEN